MIAFPNCKINIGLNIVGKRADGYHNLETIFYPIAIKDALEIIEDKNANGVNFSSSGKTILGNTTDNICVQAYQLLQKDFPNIPSIKMHLHKCIPMGAGLGGGSADASMTLSMLNKKFSLNIDELKLLDYALQLGSDCPFFIINKPCYATSRGEKLQLINLDISAYKILIIHPNIHINTAEAFAQLDVNNSIITEELLINISKDISEWKECIKNDFEIPVFKMHPILKEIKNIMYENGAIYSSMSGSGSTLYGIFKSDNIPTIHFPANYFCQLV